MFNSQNHWRKEGEDGRTGEMLQSVETLRCKQEDPSSGLILGKQGQEDL